MTNFSYSQVSLYSENPWSHFCRYVLGLNPPQSDAAARGTDIHGIFEKLAPMGGNPIENLEKLKEDPEFEMSEDHYIIVGRYLRFYSGNGLYKDQTYPWKDAVKVDCEFKVKTKIKGIDFVGYIDLVVHNSDGTVSLYDYKTLAYKPNIQSYMNGMQAHLYIIAMQNLGYTVRDFVFDCMNPKVQKAWNAYSFLRINVPVNKNMLDLTTKRYKHLVDEMTHNPSYFNTQNGWDEPLYNHAWEALKKGSEELYFYLKDNGVDPDAALTNAYCRGYPIPHFFAVERDDKVDDPEVEELRKEYIIKIAAHNRKNPDNWTKDDIEEVEEGFKYLIVMNSKGFKVYDSEYNIIPEDLIKADISDLPFDEKIYMGE